MKSNKCLAAWRLFLYVLLTLLVIPAQMMVLKLNLRSWRRIPMLYHAVCTRILGFRIVVTGEQVTDRPALFVCNHASYTDISVLGGIIEGCFIAKADVDGWPVFGFLSRLQKTIFVDRKRSSSQSQADELSTRLAQGERLILFPEGTSNDGNRVLPFKSSLFSVAEKRPKDQPLTVQPVSIAYTRIDGMAMGRWLRPFYAWYGDMELAGHLWALAGLGVVQVEVIFHPPTHVAAFGNRKELAAHCGRVVAEGVSAALCGRPLAPLAHIPTTP